MKLMYVNENGTKIEYTVNDWDAARAVAEGLINAPIDIEYLNYEDADGNGVFNLNTFERC